MSNALSTRIIPQNPLQQWQYFSQPRRTALRLDADLGWEFEPAREESEVRHNLALGPKHGVRLKIRARRPAPCSTRLYT